MIVKTVTIIAHQIGANNNRLPRCPTFPRFTRQLSELVSVRQPRLHSLHAIFHYHRGELSAHADALDFKWWFEQLAAERGIGQANVVHGESRAAQAVCALLRDHCDEEPVIPHWGESFVV